MNALENLYELHLHLDGAISPESARELAAMVGVAAPESEEELLKLLRVSSDCRDLNEFLEKFAFPCSLLTTREAIRRAVENLRRELGEQGVAYAEIRFAPQKCMDGGLTQEEVLCAAMEGAGIGRGATPEVESGAADGSGLPQVKFIVCCMRDKDNLKENLESVELAAKYLGKGVCAVDLAGAEALFPTRDFERIFDLARKLGVPATIHAGEADGPESVWKALEFGAVRIGHGVRSVEDPELMKELAKRQIPLELCPTSNLCTAIYKDLSEYPLRELMAAGIPVTINTDDPSIEGVTLKQEYEKLIEAFSLTEEEVKQLKENAKRAAFR